MVELEGQAVKIAVIGGGAAGFFSALAAKEANSLAEVFILEQSARLLTKVKISGGGRCNVTHGCFDPKLLVQHYPRGNRELLGPFHTFQPKDTIAWFKARGVLLKQEDDGRMFPITDSSDTIIHCFLKEARSLGVQVLTQRKLRGIRRVGKGFELDIGSNPALSVDRVILATGSSRAGWLLAEGLGHTIVPPVPSLFTFNIPSFSLVGLSGVSINPVKLKLEGSRLEQTGPLLITHWGFSGPAALKLSAWGARYLAEKEYVVPLLADWLPEIGESDLREIIGEERESHPAKQVSSLRLGALPKSLWRALCDRAGLSSELPLNSLGKKGEAKLLETLKRDRFQVSGKTTNKEEFVTCGGITLSEVDFVRMESKCCPGLFFCGEVMNIDGVTGGFNFQNAWTTGWIAGMAAATALTESP